MHTQKNLMGKLRGHLNLGPKGMAEIVRDSSFATKDIQKLQVLGWRIIFASEKGGGWFYIHQGSQWRYPVFPDMATFCFAKDPTTINTIVRPWPVYILERWLESLERSCPRDEVSESIIGWILVQCQPMIISVRVMSSESRTLPWAFPKPSAYWTLSGSAQWAWTSWPTSIAPACWQAVRGW